MTALTNNILDFYSSQGLVSDPKEYAAMLNDLPGDIEGLCKSIQGLLIHIFWMDRYGAQVPKERKEAEVNLRAFSRQLVRISELDNRPLSIPRPMETRLVGNCRDFTLFLTAILRHNGIPARARCGFGIYFMPGHFEDHWVGEYWDKDSMRWIMVDAQLDDFQQKQLGIQFNPLDMTPGMFVTGGQAWKKCREGKSDPQQYGIFDMRGLDFIAGDLVRDFLALNKIEILPWDNWQLIKNEKDFTPDHLELLDRMANLTENPDDNFEEIRRLFETNELIRPTKDWRP
jgi:hypothetical protein